MPTLTLDEACEAVRVFPKALWTLPKKYRTAIEVVSAAVLGNPRIFEQLPANLRDSKIVAFSATQHWPDMFRFVSARLRDDREFVVEFLSWCGRDDMFGLASTRLRADRETALAVVSKWPRCFQRLSRELRADPELIAVAARNSPTMLTFCTLTQPSWVADDVYFAGRDRRGFAVGAVRKPGHWCISIGNSILWADSISARLENDADDAIKKHTRHLVRRCLKKIESKPVAVSE